MIKIKAICISCCISSLASCTHITSKTPLKIENLPVCSGHAELPVHLTDKFELVSDKKLLQKSIGKPEEGNLCQGRVYQSKKDSKVTLYRAWNSTNPGSKLGKWWVFEEPAGTISSYRSNYEICYQWSPIDKLVSCSLKAGTKVVVGTGQSAKCSAYLTYPTSGKQQIYIDSPSDSFSDCKTFEGEFKWK